MTIEIKHPFVSAKADSLDSTRVQPSNWNEGHDIEMAANSVIGRGTGSGNAPATELPAGSVGRASLAATTQAEGRTAIDAAASSAATTTTSVGAAIHAATAKTTPVDADTMPLIDSAALNVMKKVTWANIKVTLKAYFDTVVQDLATWIAGTGTVETIISPAKLKSGAIAAGGGAPDAIIADKKPLGSSGGGSAPGSWLTRTLNTEVRDIGSVMSLGSNQFTPAVDGYVEWSAPGYRCGTLQTRLYNVTDGVEVAYGLQAYSKDGDDETQVRSEGFATVVAAKTYRIEQRTSNTQATNGMGVGAGLSEETFSWVKFWRTA